MHPFLKYSFAALFLTTAYTFPKETPLPKPVDLPAFDTEGHRGARGLMPENTVPAMRKALELGVTTLEMDAHVTKDGQVILSHDPYINRAYSLTPTGDEIPKADKEKYVLYQMNYSDIQKFDVGSKPYNNFPQQQKLKAYKPLLSEVIDSAQAYIKEHNLPQPFYNIETKSKPTGDGKFHPAPNAYVKQVMDVVEQKNVTPYVIIQSFDPRTLQELHKRYPGIKSSLLVENTNSLEANLQKLGFTPTVYSPYYKLVNADLLKKCHDKGIKVVPWTVNDLEEMKRLKQLGVDGIISDYPNLFKKL
ncbi:glycerophosphodiester phosphodiesterase family protein [Pontibacter silvestris]|uniref:Glycerophosphodiester phosphodiesterase family protein n=1 Tax=Pontibacter silvestris TaxID=2305183 RepID=A0ABW4WU00_9BACT|nr:glycerophosphodiester phosphodiesterase family protein [Pontibacter silvestris]MCC9136905.1 glycerophosphodiester phosphodiesterase [Pontibacter silvestris]